MQADARRVTGSCTEPPIDITHVRARAQADVTAVVCSGGLGPFLDILDIEYSSTVQI
jgi:hypothetical protein